MNEPNVASRDSRKIIRIVTVDLSLGLMQGQLNYLNQYFEVLAISSPGPRVTAAEKREGIQVITVPMERRMAPFKDIVSLVRLYKVLKKEKPFIVHSLTPKAGLLGMMAAYLAKVPHRLHTFTGLIFPYKQGFIQKLLITTDRLLCRCATRIFPEGEGVKKDLQKYRITDKPLEVIANGNINGIDIEYYNPERFSSTDRSTIRKQYDIPEGYFVYIFVGRLVTDKGINELVSAFDTVQKKFKNSILLLVGPYENDLDPVRPETEEAIRTHTHIRSVGWQNDVRPFMAVSDVLTFPSYREGFPNVVLQAGAMALPSIVTDISGCNEIVREEYNGVIIPSKDENMLVQAMIKIQDKAALRQQMAKNARPEIIKKYRREWVWQSLLKEYQNLEI